MRCAGSGRKPGLPVRTGGARSLAIDDRRSGGGSPQTIAAHQRQSCNRLCRKFSQSSSNFAQASVVDAAYVSFGSRWVLRHTDLSQRKAEEGAIAGRGLRK
jgi:hypothetical protein